MYSRMSHIWTPFIQTSTKWYSPYNDIHSTSLHFSIDLLWVNSKQGLVPACLGMWGCTVLPYLMLTFVVKQKQWRQLAQHWWSRQWGRECKWAVRDTWKEQSHNTGNLVLNKEHYLSIKVLQCLQLLKHTIMYHTHCTKEENQLTASLSNPLDQSQCPEIRGVASFQG